MAFPLSESPSSSVFMEKSWRENLNAFLSVVKQTLKRKLLSKSRNTVGLEKALDAAGKTSV